MSPLRKNRNQRREERKARKQSKKIKPENKDSLNLVADGRVSKKVPGESKLAAQRFCVKIEHVSDEEEQAWSRLPPEGGQGSFFEYSRYGRSRDEEGDDGV